MSDRELKRGACRSCGAEIVWITSQAGKLIPCDSREKAVITVDGRFVKGFESHFSTCPDAAKWRNAKEE